MVTAIVRESTEMMAIIMNNIRYCSRIATYPGKVRFVKREYAKAVSPIVPTLLR